MSDPYISKLKINNFRNFTSSEFESSDKQVILGENEAGKTNLLFAMQLILDPSLSDNDRCLDASDFNDKIPEDQRDEIRISLYIANFENNKVLKAQLKDATILLDGKECLKLTYLLSRDELSDSGYRYRIYKGENEDKLFTSDDRRYLQIKVIKPIRDVEYEIKNLRNSPLLKLFKSYNIPNDTLQSIAQAMHDASSAALSIDQIEDASQRIEHRLIQMLGSDFNLSTAFTMSEIDDSRILSSIKMLIDNKSLDSKSLGVKNVIYIILLLLVYNPPDFPTLMSADEFTLISDKDSEGLLIANYAITDGGNYALKSTANYVKLKEFFENNPIPPFQVTIIAIEEPEAHLHPILQRLIFKDIFKNTSKSIIMTTHSSTIASITPIEHIVHLVKKSNGETTVSTTHGLTINAGEKRDLQRYLDVRRGELYFGKGVLFVEGIAEEYVLPKLAELVDKPLDKNGIVICNINCTNFKPYIDFARKIRIPFAVITDGDFYYENASGERVYHECMNNPETRKHGFLGLENYLRMENLQQSQFSNSQQAYTQAENSGYFLGEHTFEIDVMQSSISSSEARDAIIKTFNSLTSGGDTQKKRFKTEFESGDFYASLRKIEGNSVGKGRFAQEFSENAVIDNCPAYVRKAIEYIVRITHE